MGTEEETESENEFLLLLRCLGDCGETIGMADSDASGRAADIKGLVVKALYHGYSTLYLWRRTSVPELKVDFTDFASIQVTARALLETALILDYVFKQPGTEGDQELRHCAWRLSGMRYRIRHDPLTTEWKQKQEDERKDIKSLEDRVRSASKAIDLPEDQVKKVLKRDGWRIPVKNNRGGYDQPRWKEIAQQAGMSLKLASLQYDFLSGYSHSAYPAVFQVLQAGTEAERRSLCDGTFDGAKISLALLIRDFSLLFPEASNLLDEREPERRIVEKWLDEPAHSGSDEVT